jgi:hypothetical protein
VTKPYERTPQEQAAVDAMYARKEDKHPAPWINVSNETPNPVISLDHKDLETGGVLLMGAIGTTNGAFLNGLLSQLSTVAMKDKQVSEADLNFMMSVVKDIEPAAKPSGNDPAAGQRRTCLQQACQDIHDPG